MAIKTDRDLNAVNRDLLSRARSAGDAKNYDYAITLLQSLLKTEPAFLDGRKRLRAIEIAKFKAQSALSRQMASTKVMPAQMKAAGALKKNPQEAMILAEEILAVDPFNPKGNQLLAEAAKSAGISELAALCYETIREGKPDDKENLNHLAKVYLELKDAEKAQKVYERILELDPRDGEALSGLKNSQAAHASRSGGWETATDYRGALRDKDQAIALEQAGKMMKSEEAMRAQIAELVQKNQEEPANLTYPKKIAELLEQLEDFGGATQWYQHTFDAGGQTDSSLEKKIGELSLKNIDQNITAWEAQPDSEEKTEAIAAWRSQKAELGLEKNRRMVERYPNDNQLRFELGESLVGVGLYKEAIPELQLGAKQPAARMRALNLIGVCHWKRNMLDLADKQFLQAAAEILAMDPIKKDIIYNRIQVLMAIGKTAEAVELAKQIYEVDMGYKDVAQIVEQSYTNGDTAA